MPLVGLLFLVASAAVAALVARYLGRVTHGWAREKLAHVHVRHDTVLNEATEGLMLVDIAGNVQVLNAQARDLLATPADGSAGPAGQHPSILLDGRVTRKVTGVGIARGPDGPGPAGTAVVITVADTGMGIPDVLARDVFDLGVTTKPSGPEGRSVGLHLVHEVVERWGARIERGNDAWGVFAVTILAAQGARSAGSAT